MEIEGSDNEARIDFPEQWNHKNILIFARCFETLYSDPDYDSDSGIFRYESLCPGNPELVAEYKGKIYCFASEDRLNKFMRYMVYHVWNLIL